ncbi:vesicle-trafficking protein SEC22a [Tachyglossus aculeatus]|uniref:vesicle-trafficking protein SEC22a n=1 Tax=Tachyglossus aculeatus TaxID=9261 RepID=UPI0018F3FECB|nr:vesicle-trafficking protein SEC22a [Tachyglossus aculeatus]XP_038600415.1 vesicle-trafficking protein SEC22a [Tachyglossus aculeatus]
MSAVLSAAVVRVRDGLPLSASTDGDQGAGGPEGRRLFKLLARRLSQLPDRCSLHAGRHVVHLISSLGVSYMVLCTEGWPGVLAFSFLDELQRDFIATYDTARTNTAVRPYCFIDFDTVIQRTKQRYNNPRSLATKMSLADMQTELKLRPPHVLTMAELAPANGFPAMVGALSGAGNISSAQQQRLEPATLPGTVALVLSLLCGALNLIRGVHTIESLLQSDGEDLSYVVAFLLGTAACVYQGYLLARPTSWRSAKSFLTFGLICLCNLHLSELRGPWQLLFHVTVGAFATLQIHLRQPRAKAPGYDV